MLLKLMISSLLPAMAADPDVGTDSCRVTAEASDWTLEIHQGSDAYGAGLDATVLDFRHQPSGLILWASAGQHGFVAHHFLYSRHVIETMRSVGSDFYRDPLGGIRTYYGVADISFSDEETNWSWSAEGTFHHMQSSPTSGYYHTISPDPERVNFAELIDRFGSGELGDVVVTVSFTPTDGDAISLRTARVDPDGMVELASQAERLLTRFESTCGTPD